jgi:hypothetical protein
MLGAKPEDRSRELWPTTEHYSKTVQPREQLLPPRTCWGSNKCFSELGFVRSEGRWMVYNLRWRVHERPRSLHVHFIVVIVGSRS